MTKVIYTQNPIYSYSLTIKRDLHTNRPNRYAIWKGDFYNSERECIQRGLTKEQAVEILKSN